MSNAEPAGRQPRPAWLPTDLFPFDSHFAEIEGARVHYVDGGSGPPLLLLHGNPTWSFLYRKLIEGLRDRFRCIAPDYPGFGLSAAGPGYGFTAAEHAAVLENLIVKLDLDRVTMMVQDWGGPIGFAAATRLEKRFTAFVIGNTWAWPKSDPGTQVFSRILGGPIGGYLILRRNFFVERIIPSGVRLTKLSEAVMDAYRGPFPTPESRRPTHVAFREPERRRWGHLFPEHRTVTLEGAGHYIQEDAPEQIIAAIREWREDPRAVGAGGHYVRSH